MNIKPKTSRAAAAAAVFILLGVFSSSLFAQTPTPTATPTEGNYSNTQTRPGRFLSWLIPPDVNIPAFIAVDIHGDPVSSGGGGGGDASAANQLALVAAPSRYRQPAQGATKAQIKGSAGTLNGYNFVNPNAYPVYVKLYDALAASVTVGTTVPVRTIAIPSGGFIIQENAGIALTGFTTGMTIAVTKLIGDTDATVLDTAILAEVFYK